MHYTGSPPNNFYITNSNFHHCLKIIYRRFSFVSFPFMLLKNAVVSKKQVINEVQLLTIHKCKIYSTQTYLYTAHRKDCILTERAIVISLSP